MLLLPLHGRLLRHSLILGRPLLLPLQYSLNLVAALLKHGVHFDGERVLFAHHLVRKISGFLIRAQTALVLLEVFIFDGDVV